MPNKRKEMDTKHKINKTRSKQIRTQMKGTKKREKKIAFQMQFHCQTKDIKQKACGSDTTSVFSSVSHHNQNTTQRGEKQRTQKAHSSWKLQAVMSPLRELEIRTLPMATLQFSDRVPENATRHFKDFVPQCKWKLRVSQNDLNTI